MGKQTYMRQILILVVVFALSSCAELKEIASQYPQAGITEGEIAGGLKQALHNGIEKEVEKLAREGGFSANQLVRIGLPAELQKVDKTLRDVGLGDLADRGIEILNRAAENAVSEGIPIFVDAVQEMTITDARSILLGSQDAATSYLRDKTTEKLYARFNPVIVSSLDQVGANDIWSGIINRYNDLPFTTRVNPDLSDYVTTEALEGVFAMIAIEEQEIRTNVQARTSNLLRKVFALQD